MADGKQTKSALEATFKDYDERSAILAGKKAFDANIYVNADLPPQWSYAQRALKPIVKLTEGTPYAGKNKFGKPRVTCIAGVLKIDNKKYGLHNIDTSLFLTHFSLGLSLFIFLVRRESPCGVYVFCV